MLLLSLCGSGSGSGCTVHLHHFRSSLPPMRLDGQLIGRLVGGGCCFFVVVIVIVMFVLLFVVLLFL